MFASTIRGSYKEHPFHIKQYLDEPLTENARNPKILMSNMGYLKLPRSWVKSTFRSAYPCLAKSYLCPFLFESLDTQRLLGQAFLWKQGWKVLTGIQNTWMFTDSFLAAFDAFQTMHLYEGTRKKSRMMPEWAAFITEIWTYRNY